MKTVTAREAATALFERLGSGASPDELALHFDDDVDWFIPGDASVVPWIGRKRGRAGVAEFFTQLGREARPEEFTIETIVGEGSRCVVLGHLRTKVLATGRVIRSDFAFDIEVRDGLITRYHMFEDTFAVAAAFAR
ncbi:SnoaL-like domain-containing protein [Streptomyces sp. SBST2-5]|uniref:SnoaL-like domain-containing protein n=1 Tax=Streptomyces composti TaxID=2720025 RepID=A0ABX0ZZL6_9ACTN|nr:nuclear transport factor 2 family protein [Streptomyces composti]NJP49550.1 SnoaL-like domain-containing protein [Streptomyces composti]